MNRLKQLLTLVLFTGLISTGLFAGGCVEDILTPDNKDTRVKYIDKHFKLKKMKCAERGGIQYWKIHSVSGKECAKPRVDGCNLSKSMSHFLPRNRNLMTPSCNAHDLCYATAGLTKEYCDNEFRTNLEVTSARWKGTFSARIPYMAIVKDANVSYDSAQAWAKEHCK